MSRGGSFGGGQSSLGYLFGGDEKKKNPSPPKSMPSNPTMTPPYGIDIPKQKSAENECPPPSSMTSEFIFSHNDSIDRAEGQNSGIFHNNVSAHLFLLK
ncbi:hypothetical protein LIER_26247 [Lithospermum erythrorhizon]|uniref:Protein SPIRAL1-like 5 n=1 Tax=Lithospermum erythrorhizon TaxID=34254 RepID=A0AAV3RBY3_LITER